MKKWRSGEKEKCIWVTMDAWLITFLCGCIIVLGLSLLLIPSLYVTLPSSEVMVRYDNQNIEAMGAKANARAVAEAKLTQDLLNEFLQRLDEI
jgi:hypothetical protein